MITPYICVEIDQRDFSLAVFHFYFLHIHIYIYILISHTTIDPVKSDPSEKRAVHHESFVKHIKIRVCCHPWSQFGVNTLKHVTSLNHQPLDQSSGRS